MSLVGRHTMSAWPTILAMLAFVSGMPTFRLTVLADKPRVFFYCHRSCIWYNNEYSFNCLLVTDVGCRCLLSGRHYWLRVWETTLSVNDNIGSCAAALTVHQRFLTLFILFPLLPCSNSPVAPFLKHDQISLVIYFKNITRTVCFCCHWVISEFDLSTKYPSFHTGEPTNMHLFVANTDMKSQSTFRSGFSIAS